MVPASEVDRPALVEEADARALLAAADLHEGSRILDGSEQLVVLAEPDILDTRSLRQWNLL